METCRRNVDLNGGIHLPNPHIATMEEDVLYHFALGTKSHDLKKMFGDVKFVCTGGSPKRMQSFAYLLVEELGHQLPAGQTLVNITKATDRYSMFKVGPVLSVSHGMGIPSISIMLHEIIKLLSHAGCQDVTFFRIGTSGGLGLTPGTVVITEQAVDALLKPSMEFAILGKKVTRPADLDRGLTNQLLDCAMADDHFQTVLGKTMCTDDFYEGQARLDGALCDYTEEDKMQFLREIYDKGVRNIEMECICFAAMLNQAGLKGAVVCATLLDRLKGDQVSTPHEIMSEWQQRPQKIVARYIRRQLGISSK
ncbi:uridine phosphorylase 1 [Lingula anatina]|uniref:Uridine phosphorylase 1 n=1 Tax=Lingula anatina TaxID=7574 RepID=A0A1S3ID96_LINAN|nr:uridine phosphorylase 1 [Lingula anatina]|eukprot:XP_013395409.1 uridine phosphorylase 1 [Lingula anatina]